MIRAYVAVVAVIRLELQGYLALKGEPPPRNLQQQGHMMVLRGRAVSHERGTSVLSG